MLNFELKKKIRANYKMYECHWHNFFHRNAFGNELLTLQTLNFMNFKLYELFKLNSNVNCIKGSKRNKIIQH